MLEGYAREAWERLLALGYPSPIRKMRTVQGAGAAPVIEIEFCDPAAAEASAGCQGMSEQALAHVANARCEADGRYPDGEAVIRIRSNALGMPPPVVYYVLAHELFHAFSLRGMPAGERFCSDEVPAWLSEGAAVFAGFWLVTGIGH